MSTNLYDPDAELERLYAAITGRPAFSYDPASDPVYNSYAQSYQRRGRLAMRDTMGQRAAAAQKSAETARRGNYDRLYKLIYNSGYNPNETELSDSGMTGEQAAALLAEYRRRNKIGTSNTYTYRGGTGSSKSKTKKKQRYTAPKSTRLASPGRNLDAVK